MFDPGAGAGAEWLRYDWSDHVNQQQYKASHRPPWDQIIARHHYYFLSIVAHFTKNCQKYQPRPESDLNKNILTFWNFWLVFSLLNNLYGLFIQFVLPYSDDNVRPAISVTN